jgi:hypothetical protein
MCTYTMTLASGHAFTITRRTPLRFWKSALMQLAPYGTDFLGSTYSRSRA